jgi:nitroimidazol reductase NimA-like FMN-containing flavoprotein (pyridoxamine 5'-phosphate oxidase superfamily)
MMGKLTATEIQEVLTKNTLGRIGCNNGVNTYIIPVNYVYDGKYIFCHSQPGMKIQIMRQNPKVCFEVDEIIHFSNWKSVVVLGEYQELIKERDRYNAMQFFISKMLRVKINETAKPDEIYANPASTSAFMQTAKPIIYRIFIEETSGRFEKDETWAGK